VGGIASGHDGALWFTASEPNQIGRITTSGQFTEFAVPTDQSGVDDIVAASDGALWFTESAVHQIGRITSG
jgi:virginiamycin B lyase